MINSLTNFFLILLICLSLAASEHLPPLRVYGDSSLLNRTRRLVRSLDGTLLHNQWSNLPISEEASNAGGYASSQCEPVTVPICKDLFYQHTRMPNMFNHETQEEAGLEAHQFYPLIHINCSKDLHFLICSIYTPICMTGFSHSLPPCRSVCERAKAGCAPIMRYYAFSWPERMECDQFPVLNNPEGLLCMDRDLSDAEKHALGEGQARGKKEEEKEEEAKIANSGPLSDKEMMAKLRAAAEANGPQDPNTAALKIPGVELTCSCSCRNPLVPVLTDNNSLLSQISTQRFPGCALPCHSIHFKAEADHRFVKFWLGLWSVLCLISTLATVLTFLTNPSRFEYPGQPIIYLSFCYFFVSLGYLLRVVMGHEAIACTEVTAILQPALGDPSSTPGLFFGKTMKTLILQFSLSGQAGCATVFLLTYFFGMASSVWWVVLTITWFLAAGMKWSNEAISKYTQVFHFIAWVLPGVQTGTVLMLRAVDGDPIGGLCSVGATSDSNLTFFMLLPLVIYFSIGTFFLLTGFIALCRIRNVIKFQNPAVSGCGRTNKLEKLMIKLGIFGVLYTVPAIIVISCLTYELRQRENWQLGVACSCAWKQGDEVPAIQRIKDLPAWHPPTPEYALFMLKYFMSLIVGITSGFWIWSEKTVTSWKRICTSCRSGDSVNHSHRFHNGNKSLIAWQQSGLPPLRTQSIQSPSQLSIKTQRMPSSLSQHSNFLSKSSSARAPFYSSPTTNEYSEGDQMLYTQTSDAPRQFGIPLSGITPNGSTSLPKLTRGSSSGIGSSSLVSNYACPNSANISQSGSGKSVGSEYERQQAMLPKYPNFVGPAYQPPLSFSYAPSTTAGLDHQFGKPPFNARNGTVL